MTRFSRSEKMSTWHEPHMFPSFSGSLASCGERLIEPFELNRFLQPRSYDEPAVSGLVPPDRVDEPSS